MGRSGESPIPRWPGDYADLAGRRLFVRTAGPEAGEPAVYVHGLGGSSTNWTDVMGELAGDVPGEAPDLPGFGFSPPPPDGDYSVGAHAATVISLIEARDRGPVHLLGNSLGGAVATRVAGSRPDLLRSLTLISPALPDLRPRVAPARVLAGTAPGLGPWLLGMVRRLPAEQRVKSMLATCFADPGCVHPDRLREYADEVRRRDTLGYANAAIVASGRGIVAEYFRFRRSLWRDAARVTVPTLLIYGRQDKLVDPRAVVRASRVFPGARAMVLAGCGHVAHMESPGVVAREFRTLLEHTRVT